MQVLLSTGPTANRVVIAQENGVTDDLTGDRSAMSTSIIVSDETVQLQASVFFRSLYKYSYASSVCEDLFLACGAVILFVRLFVEGVFV